MRVVCKKLLDERGGIVGHSPWLTIDKAYDVLSIFMDGRKILFYRLIANEQSTPGLHDARQFEVISGRIPQNWVADIREEVFQLSPASWLVPGFWPKFFDGEAQALRTFEEERRHMLLGNG